MMMRSVAANGKELRILCGIILLSYNFWRPTMKNVFIITVIAIFALSMAPSQSFAAGYGGVAAGGAAAGGDVILDGMIDSLFKAIFSKSPSKENKNKKEEYLAILKAEIVKKSARSGKNIIVHSFYEMKEINETGLLLTFFVSINGKENALISVLHIKKPDQLYYATIDISWNDLNEYNNCSRKSLAELLAKGGYNIGLAEDVPLGGMAYKKQPQPDKPAQAVQTTSTATATPNDQATQPTAVVPAKSPAERLAELNKMKDQGLITQDEYDVKKAEILKQM
jgi:hypothetical protein